MSQLPHPVSGRKLRDDVDLCIYVCFHWHVFIRWQPQVDNIPIPFQHPRLIQSPSSPYLYSLLDALCLLEHFCRQNGSYPVTLSGIRIFWWWLVCRKGGTREQTQVWVEFVAGWARKASDLAERLFICEMEAVPLPTISGIPLWAQSAAMEIKRADVTVVGDCPGVRAGAHEVTSLSGPRQVGGWGSIAQNNARKRETPKRGSTPSFTYPVDISCLRALPQALCWFWGHPTLFVRWLSILEDSRMHWGMAMAGWVGKYGELCLYRLQGILSLWDGITRGWHLEWVEKAEFKKAGSTLPGLAMRPDQTATGFCEPQFT